MRVLALLPLLLAACRSAPPLGTPAHVTFYGERPRLVEWRALVVEGAHVHTILPGPCLMEALEKTKPELFRGREGLFQNCPVALFGRAYGGRERLALLLFPEDEGEALAVEIPRLAPDERERTFEPPALTLELEGPAGRRRASIDRGRVTVRRAGEGRYDVEIFATLKPGGEQVLARVRPHVD